MRIKAWWRRSRLVGVAPPVDVEFGFSLLIFPKFQKELTKSWWISHGEKAGT